MFDILFDLKSREIVMDDLNNDFATTNNPSDQNGGIIQYSRCAILTFPMVGIGMEQLINGNSTNAAAEMSRWKSQVIADGASKATWQLDQTGPTGAIKTLQSYE